MQNIYDLVFKTIPASSEKAVLITKTKTYTYGDLSEGIKKFDKSLKELRVKRGEAVAVFLENSIDFISMLFASAKNEITMIPFSGTVKENESNIEHIKPELVVTNTNEKISIFDNETLELNSSIKLIRINNESFKPNKDNIAFIRMTSGTTGKAKATMLSHKTVIDRINTASKIVSIEKEDVIGWPLKMSYHFVVSLILYIKNGATIKLLDNESFLNEKHLENTSIIYASPNEIEYILNNNVKLPSSLKTFYSTSFLLSEEAAFKFFNTFKHIKLVQLYGMIECGLPLLGTYKNDLGSFWGSVAPDFEFKIKKIDELSIENSGLLLLKGKGFFDGYFGHSYEENEWFNTGEVVEVNDNGKIRVLGRLKAALELDQKLYFPENIEASINSQFGIKQSRLFKKNGSVCFEYSIGTKKVNQTEIESYLSKELSFNHKKISLNEVKKIRKTQSGKVIR